MIFLFFFYSIIINTALLNFLFYTTVDALVLCFHYIVLQQWVLFRQHHLNQSQGSHTNAQNFQLLLCIIHPFPLRVRAKLN